MSATTPRPGPGYFQWNAGAWFGSLLGGSCWLLLGAVLLGLADATLGWIWAGCFAVSLGTGLGLWWARGRLLPYPAMQTLLFILLLCAFTAFLTADLRNQLGPLVQGALGNPRFAYASLLVFPSLMIRFSFFEHTTRRRQEQRARPMTTDTVSESVR